MAHSTPDQVRQLSDVSSRLSVTPPSVEVSGVSLSRKRQQSVDLRGSSAMDKLKSVLSGEEARNDRTVMQVKKQQQEDYLLGDTTRA